MTRKNERGSEYNNIKLLCRLKLIVTIIIISYLYFLVLVTQYVFDSYSIFIEKKVRYKIIVEVSQVKC